MLLSYQCTPCFPWQQKLEHVLSNGHTDWKTSAVIQKKHAFVPVLVIYVTEDFCDSKENLLCSYGWNVTNLSGIQNIVRSCPSLDVTFVRHRIERLLEGNVWKSVRSSGDPHIASISVYKANQYTAAWSEFTRKNTGTEEKNKTGRNREHSRWDSEDY